jgi:hypothetical protein
MVLLAPALIVGIVLMHSVLVEPGAGTRHESHLDTMTAAAMDHAAHAIEATASAVAGQDDPTGHGTEGGMPDCSGLMAMCLALLVSFMVFVGRPRSVSRRVLWQRPPPTFVRMGVVREAHLVMTARQRTTVIRC